MIVICELLFNVLSVCSVRKRIFGEEAEEEAEQQCEEPNKSSDVGGAVESLQRTTTGEAGAG